MKDENKIWRWHIEKQNRSGQTIRRYCERNKLSEGLFYYWRRKLQNSDQSEQISFEEVKILSHPQFIPVIEIQFEDSKARIRIEGQVTASFIRELAGC